MLEAATPWSSRVWPTSSMSIPSFDGLHQLMGIADVGVDGARKGAVVFERVDGALWKGVDRVRTDELIDVEGVGIARVLRRGGRPERPLYPRAVLYQPVPSLTGVGRQEQPVGEFCLGDGRLTTKQRPWLVPNSLETPVDLGVHPADEEGSHTVHPGRSPPLLDNVSRPDR